MSDEVEWWEYDDAAEMAAAVAGDIGFIIESAIEARGAAVIALAGGKTPVPIYEKLSSAKLDWKRVTIIPGDERIVPLGDPLSNVTVLAKYFLPKGAGIMQQVGLRGAQPAQPGQQLTHMQPGQVLGQHVGRQGARHMAWFQQAQQGQAPGGILVWRSIENWHRSNIAFGAIQLPHCSRRNRPKSITHANVSLCTVTDGSGATRPVGWIDASSISQPAAVRRMAAKDVPCHIESSATAWRSIKPTAPSPSTWLCLAPTRSAA